MVQPACALLQWKKRSHGGGFWAYYWCCCFLWLAFNSVQLTKADAVTDCLNACHETDIACRAKCVPVPFGGVDSVTHTGNCIATCQRNFPIDPRAQSSCYSSCFTEFVNPPPHLQPPPHVAPSPSNSPSPNQPSSEDTSDTDPEKNTRPPPIEDGASSLLLHHSQGWFHLVTLGLAYVFV